MAQLFPYRLILLAAMLATASANANEAPAPLQPLAHHATVAVWTSMLLSRHHPAPKVLDDAMSAKIFDSYLSILDPDRAYFTQADVDQFSTARNKFDDAIKNDNLKLPFTMFNLLAQRALERYRFTKEKLALTPDFTLKESFAMQREGAAWPASDSALQDHWRKAIKHDWLTMRLTGASDAHIAAFLQRRNDRGMAHIKNLKPDAVLEFFLNAYGGAMDSHTNYTAPPDETVGEQGQAPRFGIGSAWKMRDGFVTLYDISPDGPTAMNGQFNIGDRLIGIGQGAGAPIDSVLGDSIDETIERVRGARDTTVVLDILPVDAVWSGKHRHVALIRRPVPREAASSAIVSLPLKGMQSRVGVVRLPSFYHDHEARKQGKPYASSAHDIVRLLQKLRDDKVDAILLDLRDNAGGPVTEVASLARLFIGNGPIGQEVQTNGKVDVRSAEADPGAVAWDGLMGVLVNRRSVAGAEILAAAIQDYGRGIIIGENTFGMGMIHTEVNFDRNAADRPRNGKLRMPVAQFFRINGQAIQIRGVSPDIDLPNSIDGSAIGESLLDNAMPWSQRAALDHTQMGDVSAVLPMLKARHAARMQTNLPLRKIVELSRQFVAQSKQQSVTLNEAERRKELEEAERKIQAIGPPGTSSLDAAVLKEAAAILADESDILRSDAALARRVRPNAQ